MTRRAHNILKFILVAFFCVLIFIVLNFLYWSPFGGNYSGYEGYCWNTPLPYHGVMMFIISLWLTIMIGSFIIGKVFNRHLFKGEKVLNTIYFVFHLLLLMTFVYLVRYPLIFFSNSFLSYSFTNLLINQAIYYLIIQMFVLIIFTIVNRKKLPKSKTFKYLNIILPIVYCIIVYVVIISTEYQECFG